MSPVFVYTVASAVAAAALFGAIRLFGRRAADEGTEADARASRLEVVARRRVGLGRTLVIVEAEGRRLLLGSTWGAWAALADLGPARDRRGGEPGDAIEAELNRAFSASRFRRGGSAR
ncbi:MAG TPA: flagellar biosynthetic protein FliO [Candidatus Eisenbacteria bacterium]